MHLLLGNHTVTSFIVNVDFIIAAQFISISLLKPPNATKTTRRESTDNLFRLFSKIPLCLYYKVFLLSSSDVREHLRQRVGNHSKTVLRNCSVSSLKKLSNESQQLFSIMEFFFKSLFSFPISQRTDLHAPIFFSHLPSILKWDHCRYHSAMQRVREFNKFYQVSKTKKDTVTVTKE